MFYIVFIFAVIVLSLSKYIVAAAFCVVLGLTVASWF